MEIGARYVLRQLSPDPSEERDAARGAGSRGGVAKTAKRGPAAAPAEPAAPERSQIGDLVFDPNIRPAGLDAESLVSSGVDPAPVEPESPEPEAGALEPETDYKEEEAWPEPLRRAMAEERAAHRALFLQASGGYAVGRSFST